MDGIEILNSNETFKPNIWELEINLKFKDGRHGRQISKAKDRVLCSYSVLLESSPASDELISFKHVVEEEDCDIDETIFWHERRIG